MKHELIQEVLQALDRMEVETTPWEAEFLNSVMQQGYPLTERQVKVLAQMAERYNFHEYAAELRGQQRLFPENARRG